jgi:hypothetical protein
MNTMPTGEGQVRGLDSAGVPGTPLPSRPERAKANDADAPCHDTTSPPDYAGEGRVDMTARLDPIGGGDTTTRLA